MTLSYILLYLTVLSCVAMLAYRLGRRSVIWGAPPAPKVEETYSRAQVDELLEKMNQRLKMHWSHEKHRYMLCSKYGPPKNDFDSKHDNARALNKTVFDDLRARMGDADGAFVRLEWSYVNDYNHVKDDWIQAPLTGKADVDRKSVV